MAILGERQAARLLGAGYVVTRSQSGVCTKVQDAGGTLLWTQTAGWLVTPPAVAGVKSVGKGTKMVGAKAAKMAEKSEKLEMNEAPGGAQDTVLGVLKGTDIVQGRRYQLTSGSTVLGASVRAGTVVGAMRLAQTLTKADAPSLSKLADKLGASQDTAPTATLFRIASALLTSFDAVKVDVAGKAAPKTGRKPVTM